MILGFPVACTTEYITVEATIIDVETNAGGNGNFRATLEYFIDSVRYTDQFDVSIKRMVEDSISVPDPGITFEIMVDPNDPARNKIEFNVRANYVNE